MTDHELQLKAVALRRAMLRLIVNAGAGHTARKFWPRRSGIISGGKFISTSKLPEPIINW